MENEFKSSVIEMLRKRLTKPDPELMLEIAETMRVSVLKNFETEGSRLGKRWAKLAKETIKQRERKGYWPGKILQRTGQLKRSIISSYGNDYAQVSTNLIYAAIQNYGGLIHRSSLKRFIRKRMNDKDSRLRGNDIPKGNKMTTIRIPARPFMKLTDKDLEDIKESILRKLKGE
jgi:phage virion morphogenesis protein